jgi:hypothetical protein
VPIPQARKIIFNKEQATTHQPNNEIPIATTHYRYPPRFCP